MSDSIICRICEENGSEIKNIFSDKDVIYKIISCADVSFKQKCELTDRKWRTFQSEDFSTMEYNDNTATTDDLSITYSITNNNIEEINNENTSIITDNVVEMHQENLSNNSEEELVQNGIYNNENEIIDYEDYIIEEYCENEDDKTNQNNYETENALIIEAESHASYSIDYYGTRTDSKKFDKADQSITSFGTNNYKVTNNSAKKPATLTGKMFQCDTCKAVFSLYTELNVHKKTHGDHRYQCEICLKWFAKRFRLRNHFLIHSDNKISYSNRGNLDRHIRHLHKKERPYVCSICGLSFSRSIQTENRKTQITDKTKISEKLKCEFCEKISKSRNLHSSHMRTHTGQKPFACS